MELVWGEEVRTDDNRDRSGDRDAGARGAPRGEVDQDRPDPEVVAKPTRRPFTAEYRLRIVEEADWGDQAVLFSQTARAVTLGRAAGNFYRKREPFPWRGHDARSQGGPGTEERNPRISGAGIGPEVEPQVSIPTR